MDAYKIIAGFSEIKAELRKKAKIKKSMAELSIWFSFEDDVLYAHDDADHKKNIVLAIYNQKIKSWRIFLRKGTYGHQVIDFVIGQFELKKIQKEINRLNRLYGFGTFG